MDMDPYGSISTHDTWQLLVSIYIHAIVPNVSWSVVVPNPGLHEIIRYANPLIKETNAMVSHSTVRHILIDKYNRHRSAVIHVLRTSPGQIYIAFDGWQSRNKQALYRITYSYLD